jgi:hypothetical protein
MSLRKLLMTILVLWLGLVGIVCGFLCLACLILVLFWQGLGVSTSVLALTCLLCLGLAFVLTGRVAITERGARRTSHGSLLGRIQKSHNCSDRPPTEERLLDDHDGHRQASDFEDWFRESAEKKR